MPKYLIERTIPGAANLTAQELQAIAQKSMCAMEHLPGYAWHESYVFGDRVLCVHEAQSEQQIREHSRRGGFPIDRITPIASVFGPGHASETLAENAP